MKAQTKGFQMSGYSSLCCKWFLIYSNFTKKFHPLLNFLLFLAFSIQVIFLAINCIQKIKSPPYMILLGYIDFIYAKKLRFFESCFPPYRGTQEAKRPLVQGSKVGYPKKFLKWFKMKILLCKAGKRKFLYFIKIFDCLVKFWTLLYSSKTQWSNSQKANFICFNQGQFFSEF